MPDTQPTVLKAAGHRQPWDAGKLRASLLRAGVPVSVADEVVRRVADRLPRKIASRALREQVEQLLALHDARHAARYRLKQAILELGPEGHLFERLVGRILQALGFSVQVGQVVQGRCVKHEVDVVALKYEAHFMVECKFHHVGGRKCDVKTPLYVYARFKDIEAQWVRMPGHATRFHQVWVVNNTRFTADALQYGRCVGMHLVSWDFPEGDSLPQLVARTGTWPLTCLAGLSRRQKRGLLARGALLCADLVERPELLDPLDLQAAERWRLMAQAEALCAMGGV